MAPHAAPDRWSHRLVSWDQIHAVHFSSSGLYIYTDRKKKKQSPNKEKEKGISDFVHVSTHSPFVVLLKIKILLQ